MKTLFSLAGQLVVSLGLAATWGRMLILSLLLLSLLTIPVTAASAQSATLTPKEVVEYALTLEKLEADMYSRAFTAIKSGGLMSLPEPAKKAIKSYGQDEGMHVTDLSAVLTSLGGNPDAIAIPKNPNYDAILNRDPFNNPEDFLLALQYVEDTGVAAYKGQVQNLLAAGDAGKVVLAGALEIHTIEARHAAGVRYLRQTYYGADVRPWVRDASEVLFNKNREGSNSPIPFSNEAFDGFATKDEVIALVGPILTEK
ncbi:ferritin-like domain-containing protein [Tolypothrix sp. VBCCA 56010]|uniref:ferritin-like domain-containing protein n=1 Tax=Tolypothrix sp. VBCCA 56010 TaxID=3137731 RepID=UPI003D7CF19C